MTTRREFLGQAGMGLAMAATLPTARALGANDRIRIGLIGAGDRGMEDLKTALKQPNVECVAVADIYSRQRDKAKQVVPNATIYDDPMKLLESKDVDAVINATPLHLHKKYFVATLAGGQGSVLREDDDVGHSGSGGVQEGRGCVEAGGADRAAA